MTPRSLVLLHEGTRLKAYRDNRGFWTIGTGHNIQADPSLLPLLQHLITDGITQTQADRLLDADLRQVEASLSIHLPWLVRLDQVRYAVIVDMAFELGVAGLLEFTDFLRFMSCGKWRQSADDLLHTKLDQEVPNRVSHNVAMILSGRDEPYVVHAAA